MTMNDREITDLVRQMAAPPKPPTYGEAEVEELVRMHAGGRTLQPRPSAVQTAQVQS